MSYTWVLNNEYVDGKIVIKSIYHVIMPDLKFDFSINYNKTLYWIYEKSHYTETLHWIYEFFDVDIHSETYPSEIQTYCSKIENERRYGELFTAYLRNKKVKSIGKFIGTYQQLENFINILNNKD